jgi:hypothetical protein
MVNHGQVFLAQLARLPADTFEHRFGETSTSLGLGLLLNRNELILLYEAALRATLCNVVINRLADGKLVPAEEPSRIRSEREFMLAREIFYASPGWQNLPLPKQWAIDRTLLQVSVAESRLAR